MNLIVNGENINLVVQGGIDLAVSNGGVNLAVNGARGAQGVAGTPAVARKLLVFYIDFSVLENFALLASQGITVDNFTFTYVDSLYHITHETDLYSDFNILYSFDYLQSTYVNLVSVGVANEKKLSLFSAHTDPCKLTVEILPI